MAEPSAVIINFINCNDLISLVTLSTLNTLRIRTALNALNELPDPVRKIISKRERLTIKASKIFILSATYSDKP